MEFLKVLKSFVTHLGSAVLQALGHATARGLSDAVLNSAIGFVKDAATAEGSVLNNVEKKNYVAKKLVVLFHLPESVANLAVELAVQAVKAEIAAIPTR